MYVCRFEVNAYMYDTHKDAEKSKNDRVDYMIKFKYYKYLNLSILYPIGCKSSPRHFHLPSQRT